LRLELVVVFQNTSTGLLTVKFFAAAVIALESEGRKEGGREGGREI